MSGPAATATAAAPQTLSVRVPMTFRKRGGRKVIVMPGGHAASPAMSRPERTDSPLLKAVVRAHRWRRLLERGDFNLISELAASEHVDKSYVSKVLRLTLLSPALVEAILDGIEPHNLRFETLLKPFDDNWKVQSEGFIPPSAGEESGAPDPRAHITRGARSPSVRRRRFVSKAALPPKERDKTRRA